MRGSPHKGGLPALSWVPESFAAVDPAVCTVGAGPCRPGFPEAPAMRRYRGPERFPGRICSFGAPAVTGDSPAAVRSARSSIVPTSVTARLSGVNSLSNGRKPPNGQSGDIRRGEGGTMALVRRLRLGARLGASFAVVLVLLGVVVAIGAIALQRQSDSAGEVRDLQTLLRQVD